MTTRVFLIILFVIGAALGLAYAWLIDPVTYSESSPAQVTKAYREAWLIMTAEAYAQDGDWERTQARVNSLRADDLAQTLTQLFDRYQAAGPNPTARALARLADRLNVRTPAMQVYLVSITTPTPERTGLQTPPAPHTSPVATRPIDAPRATFTMTPEPPPTLTPTVTPIPEYQVIERVAECTASPNPPQIRVIVHDQFGQSVAGQEIRIKWDNGSGSDRFVTGLKPEIDPGYGDFDMEPDQSYNVEMGKPASVVVSDLRAEPCADGRTSWRLILAPRTP
jgi:hypothetical protein